MDKSLDDMITTRRGGARRPGGRRSLGRQAALGSSATPAGRAKAAIKVAVKATPSPAGPTANKIIVSGLPNDVNESQIRELFQTTVGPLHSVQLSYDQHGRSKGIASVQFSRSGDGNKAYTQYNNRLIDGKRAMKIEIVVDPKKDIPLSSRVAPATPAVAAAPKATPSTRGRGGRRGRGGKRKTERPPKTAADLDQEMEDYTTNNAAAPATATA